MKKTAPPQKRGPRYRDIADVLRNEIATGRYPIGASLPTEQCLCRMFDASRHTVREALRTLTAEELIVRRTRAGSKVVATHSPTVYAQSVSSIAQLLNYPETCRKTVASRQIRADAELAALLRCEPGSRWFRLSTLRHPAKSTTPLCWIDIYLEPRYAGVTGRRDHEHRLICDQIIDMYGVTLDRVQVELSAGRVPARMAKRLKVAAGSPGLFVLRRYLNPKGEAFEITLSVHPAQRYRYAFEVKRSGPKVPGRPVPAAATAMA
jgi:DNA-binding GntR family transcriptional regulator